MDAAEKGDEMLVVYIGVRKGNDMLTNGSVSTYITTSMQFTDWIVAKHYFGEAEWKEGA